ncbi:MAG: ABC transporter ATP-binding protein [Sedimenticola selenatireducens]|uniref:ABC transporter ATP-binding protein n=1 Tax=Sedimenticola selenatireducens TaxID=191960 RepID=A0A2N6CWF2_9GAMM|nr:ABC transporter ATP-binding protein [Sedimenticola selenatireducens]PLX61592.1 MAG: ABC transporter ATP-binding protein [Sedimenticola selenatireducens]
MSVGTVLSLKNVSKSYGALKVTDDIDFILNNGETLGILGPNGAGKTTLFNLISGDVRADNGSIFYLGEDITSVSPQNRCRQGIGRTYQIPHPFSGMTVFENLLVGATYGGNMSEDEADPICIDVLRKTGLIKKANLLSGSLTLLDRKRLELARALATQPKVLLLDEIAGGLTEHEANELVDLIGDIKAEGVSMIWIEHVVHALLSVADRLLVINFGSKLADGNPDKVMNDPEVKRVYMGIEV